MILTWAYWHITDFSGLSTYGLKGYEKEMSTPPTFRRGMVDFTFYLILTRMFLTPSLCVMIAILKCPVPKHWRQFVLAPILLLPKQWLTKWHHWYVLLQNTSYKMHVCSKSFVVILDQNEWHKFVMHGSITAKCASVVVFDYNLNFAWFCQMYLEP